MNPRRLVDLEPQGIHAQLLRAGRAMQPPDSTYQKTFLGLGVAGTTLGASKLVGAAVGASSAKSLLSGVLVKWIAIGFVGSTSLLGAAHVSGVWNFHVKSPTSQARHPASRLPTHASGNAAKVAPQAEVIARASIDPASSSVAPGAAPTTETALSGAMPSAVPMRGAIQSGASTPQAASSTSRANLERQLQPEALPSALAAEVTLVDEIRRALDGGEPARALDLIDQHRRRFTAPRLGEEVAFFRARALKMAGRRTEAQRALEDFEADYPASPLTELR